MLYLHLSSRSPFFATSFHKCSLRFPDMLSSPASPSSPIPAYQNFTFLFDSPVVYAIFQLWRLLVPVVSFPKVLVVTVMPWAVCNFRLLDRPEILLFDKPVGIWNAVSPPLSPSSLAKVTFPNKHEKTLPQ